MTLPSQWYSFDLVEQAIDRHAVIIVLGGGNDWDVAVPSLRDYDRRFPANTPRSSWVSRGNLPEFAFDQVLEALRLAV